MNESTPAIPRRSLDVGALKALAHPLRVRIYDMLGQEPQTASSLAEMLGESSGSTSYHLRALARHDLIREVPDRGTARERWWERPKGGVELVSREAMRTPAGRAAAQVVMSEHIARRHQQLTAWLAQAMSAEAAGEIDEWQKPSLVSTAVLRMTSAQLADFSAQMQDLIDGAVRRYADQQGEGLRSITLHTDLFPTPAEGTMP